MGKQIREGKCGWSPGSDHHYTGWASDSNECMRWMFKLDNWHLPLVLLRQTGYTTAWERLTGKRVFEVAVISLWFFSRCLWSWQGNVSLKLPSSACGSLGGVFEVGWYLSWVVGWWRMTRRRRLRCCSHWWWWWMCRLIENAASTGGLSRLLWSFNSRRDKARCEHVHELISHFRPGLFRQAGFHGPYQLPPGFFSLISTFDFFEKAQAIFMSTFIFYHASHVYFVFVFSVYKHRILIYKFFFTSTYVLLC